MNQVITAADLPDPNTDLVSVLLGMMKSTATTYIKTLHGVQFTIEEGKLRLSGPEYEICHELMLAIGQMKCKIIGEMY